jgi:hypothetical protein
MSGASLAAEDDRETGLQLAPSRVMTGRFPHRLEMPCAVGVVLSTVADGSDSLPSAGRSRLAGAGWRLSREPRHDRRHREGGLQVRTGRALPVSGEQPSHSLPHRTSSELRSELSRGPTVRRILPAQHHPRRKATSNEFPVQLANYSTLLMVSMRIARPVASSKSNLPTTITS